MEQDIQESAMGDNPHSKAKSRRTPLKQTPMPRSVPQSPTVPIRRRRKRIGGKRTVRSCTSCRAAHVRCVADRYGVPCERCAKKSWMDCTLMQKQPEQAPKTTPTDQDDHLEVTDPAETAGTASTTDNINDSEVIDITDTADISNNTDTAETVDVVETIDITDETDANETIDTTDTIDPSSSHARILKQIASDALAPMAEGVTSEPPREAPGCTTQ
ncbi:hypothetical protein O1611_g2757 [Lasiodiplodia mahajangana]|uniref:Uncharacterized protein n=1 Tax=Lasiodiplodia mahajangana TaxID=1108764 RepID=A0ACC2JU05_9PEZI|nr:hypothetical protein O1611_g2757 [Lasiodiplodia mahajangana]